MRSVSRELSFNADIVFNVLNAETAGSWDCTRPGAAGEVGCFQIIPKHHPTVDPEDFEASLRYFIRQYQAGYGYLWVPCSCWGHIKANKIKDLPRTKDIVLNSRPLVGAVAVFKFGEVAHYAYVTELSEKGFFVSEANKTPCRIDERVFYEWGHENLEGFFMVK